MKQSNEKEYDFSDVVEFLPYSVWSNKSSGNKRKRYGTVVQGMRKFVLYSEETSKVMKVMELKRFNAKHKRL